MGLKDTGISSLKLDIQTILDVEDLMKHIFMAVEVYSEEGIINNIYFSGVELLKKDENFCLNYDKDRFEILVNYHIFKSYFFNGVVLNIYTHRSFNLNEPSANNTVFFELNFTHGYKFRYIIRGEFKDQVEIYFQ